LRILKKKKKNEYFYKVSRNETKGRLVRTEYGILRGVERQRKKKKTESPKPTRKTPGPTACEVLKQKKKFKKRLGNLPTDTFSDSWVNSLAREGPTK